ncbi:outer membrane protein [Alteraurantiacibacter aquimixticola]|uniref:Porin family protein n=1 Tax=Alteraurantiacibacter aquimixticola TaxID=2489173 RepID=A0A4T3F685_9SPHN|nr:porin family protein [Alteraurantiacibacter aquimixticola]TIX50366.1 porin family protein [Alteraurantiacibacter aquimixticola]
MYKGIALLAAASGIAMVAAPAAAQESSPFTGPRIEGIVGYDIVRPGSTVDIDNADDVDQSIEDVTYGVGAGYDFDLGGAVVGVEAEYMKSEASTSYDTTAFTGFGVSNVDAGRDLYLGVRAGVLATPSTLVYAKGGYTNASMDVLASDNVTDIETDANLDGWRVGAGVEQAIGENFFIKGEYRYSNYEEGEFEAPSGLESDRFDVDLDRHQVVVGVGARF